VRRLAALVAVVGLAGGCLLALTPSGSRSKKPRPTTTTTVVSTTTTVAPTTTTTTATTGFPDETTTGPTGPCTTTHNGDLEIDTPNTVIDGYCIEDGSIIIGPNATNLTVRNTEIRSVGFAGGFFAADETLRGLTVEDTYIDCQLGGGSSGVAGADWQGHRLEIRNCENGINTGSNVVLTASFIHMPNNEGSSHADGINIYEGTHDVLIAGNAVNFPLASSSIQFHSSTGVQNHDVTVQNNRFLGGAFVMRVPGDNPSCQPPNPSCGPWDNLFVTGNRLDLLVPSQEFGLCSGDPISIEVWADNVVDSTNQPLPQCQGSP
jgi:hypothetical protein